MKRLLVRILLALLALAALALALRQDLADRALRRGAAQLRAGDVAGAEAAFRQAVSLGKDGAPLRYNLGVTLYRKGEFAQARSHFDAAITAAGTGLMPAALYNRGNSLVREAERLTARDRQAAMGLLEAAVADYAKTLALAPRAADARGNLALAQARLRALAAGREGPARERRGGSGEGARAGEKAASGPRKEAGKPTSRTDSSGTGTPRRDLTRSEVERMLNDARGRERPAGPLHGDRKAGRLAGPDKDW